MEFRFKNRNQNNKMARQQLVPFMTAHFANLIIICTLHESATADKHNKWIIKPQTNRIKC